MRNFLKSTLVTLGLVGAVALGGCATANTQSGSDSSSSITGQWELFGYEDETQSLDADALAAYGYSGLFLTVDEDGTFDLAGSPGTWKEENANTFKFTLPAVVESETGSQSAEEVTEESTDTVFDVTYADEKLSLSAGEGAHWIFERSTESDTQSE